MKENSAGWLTREPKDGAEAIDFMRAVLVYSHCDFDGAWNGWQLRGRELVSPSGERITPHRLQGILFSEANRARRAKVPSRKVKVDPRPCAQIIELFPPQVA